ncbi:MAG: YitT family protein [Clostridiales bacterium]|nr:YitT family protein [Clostridiales bacterium]
MKAASWNWKEFAGALGGTFLFAFAVNVFIVPQDLYNGNLLGISQLLRTLVLFLFPVHFPFDIAGIISYLLNIPMLILAYVALSRSVFVKTVVCVTLQTVFLTLIPIPATPVLNDELAGCVIGGLVAGYGCGLVLRFHFTGGGTDVLGLVLTKRYTSFSVGKLSIVINIFVYSICALTQNIETAIYSIIYAVATSLVIDRVHSENICSEATIFCPSETDAQEIVRYLVDTLHRTATRWEGVGGYSGSNVHIIYTVVSQYELRFLERYLKHNHRQAFLVKQHNVGITGHFEKYLL